MMVCTTKKIEGVRSKGRKIEAGCSGGDITSDPHMKYLDSTRIWP